MLRRVLIAVAVCGVACVLGRPALASPNHTVTTANFTVSYDTDPKQSDFATATQAGAVAAYAERALAAEEAWGFDAPVPAPGGTLYITIVDLSKTPGIAYQWGWGSETPPTYTSINLAKSELGAADEAHTIAGAVFMMIESRYWIPAGYTGGGSDGSEDWLLTGPGQWAASKLDGYASPGKIGPPEVPLDCHDYDQNFEECSTDGFLNGGDGRWPFYELLAQRYGPSFLKSVWQSAQSTDAIDGLAAAIAARGGSLADAANDYAVREAAGGWGISTLDALAPVVTGSAVSTGAVTGPIPSTTVTVDHLATRTIKLTRGDGHGEHACFAATLSLSVAIPPGTSSRPYFYWSRDAAPQAMPVSGSTAGLSVPWDTCTWAAGAAYIALPNDSLSVDGATFTVSGSLAVDTTRPATPGPDPTPAAVGGPVVAVPTSDVAPTIDVFGPLLLRVAASSPTIRLIVHSNAEGAVRGTLGSVDLGSVHIRPGANDVRFKVSKTLLSALRRSSASGNVLTLTPVSSSGAASGMPVTRRISVTRK